MFYLLFKKQNLFERFWLLSLYDVGLFRSILFVQNNPLSEIYLKFQGDLLSYCTGNLSYKEETTGELDKGTTRRLLGRTERLGVKRVMWL